VDRRKLGTALLSIGALILVVTIVTYPPPGFPGSPTLPLQPHKILSSQSLMLASENLTFPRDFYIEVKRLSPSVTAISKPQNITTLTYKEGNYYYKSYVYKATLTKEEYLKLASMDDVIGIWDVPTIRLTKLTGVEETLYGNMEDALHSTAVDNLIAQGKNGTNTIIAIIDYFPPQAIFFSYFPRSWADRILHYPSETFDELHGVMTASISAKVSPNAKLYLVTLRDDILQSYQEVIDLVDLYPGYKIICSNSYCLEGWAYYMPNHVVNRKVLEMVDKGIYVLFAVGNWAHEGEHNPAWTLDVGYDARNIFYGRDEEIGYPAVFNSVISVAGCSSDAKYILSYSSLGRGVDNHDEPDVSAPTHFSYEYSPYDAIGTSASCPFMAGICANILTDKDVTPYQLVEAIHRYSMDRGYRGFDVEFGYGIVNATMLYDEVENVPPRTVSPMTMYMAGVSLIGIGIVFRFGEERRTYKWR